MNNENIITSVQNPRIKELIKLRKTNVRKKTDLIVVEGRQEVEMAIRTGFKIEELFVCPELIGKDFTGYGVEPTTRLTTEVFNKVSMRENPDGIIALVKPRYIKLEQVKLCKSPLIIVAESVEKPGNLGAIIRTADACGVDVVIINDLRTDIYNPNVIRASIGAVFSVPVVIAEKNETARWLKEKNISSYATTPIAVKKYNDVDLRSSIAILIGSEPDGLSEFWLSAADEKILIPMSGKINSLNASVSAAIVLYEARRQRGFSVDK